MDDNDAQTQLSEVRKAYRDSARPALPPGVTVSAGILAAVGIALLGQSSTATWLPFLGLALAVAAFLVPLWYRSRHGLRGVRGQARNTDIVLGLAVVTLFICGLTANTTMAWIYPVLGIAFGVNYFFALRGWGIPK